MLIETPKWEQSILKVLFFLKTLTPKYVWELIEFAKTSKKFKEGSTSSTMLLRILLLLSKFFSVNKKYKILGKTENITDNQTVNSGA